ncbi:MAG: fimbrillin family protein [Tannerellaceae bacterium]|jgi:hypothetical protein|nr:fimbrillin family protein [Tannerellaceae bacterium]
MKKRLFLSVAATAMIFAGCSKEIKTDNAGDKVALQVSSNLTGVETRVSGTNWEANDAIGIFRLEAGTTTVLDANKQYETANGGTPGTFAPASPGETIYFPMALTPKSDFIAYYPYKPAQTNLTYVIDVSNQNNQQSIDLLTADKVTGKDRAAPAVSFIFKHRLAKIEMKISAGGGLTGTNLEGLTVTLDNQETTANFDLGDNTLLSTGASGEITLKTDADGRSAEAIILPQGTVSGRKLTFTLTSGDEFHFDVSGASYVAGAKTEYVITINRTGITVNGTTIVDWTTGGSIPGSAEM